MKLVAACHDVFPRNSGRHAQSDTRTSSRVDRVPERVSSYQPTGASSGLGNVLDLKVLRVDVRRPGRSRSRKNSYSPDVVDGSRHKHAD